MYLFITHHGDASRYAICVRVLELIRHTSTQVHPWRACVCVSVQSVLFCANRYECSKEKKREFSPSFLYCHRRCTTAHFARKADFVVLNQFSVLCARARALALTVLHGNGGKAMNTRRRRPRPTTSRIEFFIWANQRCFRNRPVSTFIINFTRIARTPGDDRQNIQRREVDFSLQSEIFVSNISRKLCAVHRRRSTMVINDNTDS